ncbi:tyrosine--tRNA ligase [Candidatus Erwinia haradaeae]|uniref:Tyrosine--tRNA ligase n=1 Tax=Candidatus Erwinia haradaeae TaxID=1922217 RepID=A0A803FUK4_9GAMM|nr:tyrosine--tRNA ligase [Candidatus Erwinia haradaeae]VFP88258.1 Tyrosine--tRNA ligase [Candidatus Erwinia haradaeae]
MPHNTLLQRLKKRGLILQVTHEKILEQQLEKKAISLYCGFDPTSDSLHIGHLIPLICLQHFQTAGHKPIVLLGGATGLIGDPSFKEDERTLHTKETINRWTEKINLQLMLFLDFNYNSNSAMTTNNYEWFGSMNTLNFLRDIGKHFSINQMLVKDAVSQRLNRHSQGISFTEFSYNLLQSYDFSYLNKSHSVILQIGGSDQWGNIVSGINLTRRLNKNQVFGLTLPLLTKFDGSKFGKTTKGTIWLDPKKTSPYKFYQFWLNTADSDVYRFLRFLTCMNIEEIDKLEEEDKNSSRAPVAQGLLANKVTKLVHGENGLLSAKRITNSLFSGNAADLTKEDLKQLSQDGINNTQLEIGQDLKQALVNTDLATSRSHARNLIITKSIKINGSLQINSEYIFCKTDQLFGRYTILQCGKRNYALINWKQL